MYLEPDNNELKEYLKKQIEELEKEANKKCFEYKNNIKKLNKYENDLLSKKNEYDLYLEFYPKWEEVKSISEENLNLKINTFNFIEEVKDDVKFLEDNISILNNTVRLQKDNIDLLIKKIVDLNVNLSWISRD